MANTGGFFSALGNSLFGGGSTALQQLQNNGYSQYQVTGAPDVSKNFQGYGVTNANTSANSPYMQAQGQLLNQLQSQANGTGGPTMADQQLHAGMGASLAAQKAAMAGARGQNAGLASGQLGTEAAGTQAGYAGQAGAQRAQEQQQAQGQLSGLTQGAIGQGNQLGEFNAGEQNQGRQYDAGLQAQLGNLNNQDWQYKNNIGAEQQSQQNGLIGQQVNGQVAQQNALAGSVIGGLMPSPSNVGAAAGAFVADGGVFGMADGGISIPSQASNEFHARGPLSPISASAPPTGGGMNPAALAGMFGGGKPNGQMAIDPGAAPSSQALNPGQLQAPMVPNPDAGNLTLQMSPAVTGAGYMPSASLGGTQALQNPAAAQPQPGFADGDVVSPPKRQAREAWISQALFDKYAPPQTKAEHVLQKSGLPSSPEEWSQMPVPMMATGDVANGPQKAIIGENGPEAVVPIKPNGDVDHARARNPALQALLAQHPDLHHIEATGKQPGQPTGTGDHATAAALAQAGAHLSDRVAQLEATIGHLARRNQRMAA